MTELLEQAVEATREMAPDMQDHVARLILDLAQTGAAPVVLSVDERSSFDASKAEADRQVFATDEQVRAVWARHGL